MAHHSTARLKYGQVGALRKSPPQETEASTVASIEHQVVNHGGKIWLRSLGTRRGSSRPRASTAPRSRSAARPRRCWPSWWRSRSSAAASSSRSARPPGRVECYIEVPFILGEKRLYPDGLIRVTRGSKTWTALVEVKTGPNQLATEQLENYLDIAREQGFDAVSPSPTRSRPSPAAPDQGRQAQAPQGRAAPRLLVPGACRSRHAEGVPRRRRS